MDEIKKHTEFRDPQQILEDFDIFMKDLSEYSFFMNKSDKENIRDF